MPRYAMVNEGGTVETVFLHDSADLTAWAGKAAVLLPDDSPVGPGYVRSGLEFAAPAPVVRTFTRMTVLAFRNRFTMPEKISLELFQVPVAGDPAPTAQARAMLRANEKDTAAALFIDPSRADTRAGVLGLEQIGLLAAGRALIILDTPIAAHEALAEDL